MSRKQQLYEIIGQAFLELASLETDTPVSPSPLPVVPTTPGVRLGSWVSKIGLTIKRLQERPDAPLRNATYMYVIKDLFTTRAGSWDPSGEFCSVDQWARDAYLKAPTDPLYLDEGGADHNLFGMILGVDGKPLKAQTFRYWSDGFAQLNNSLYQGYQEVRSSDKNGWANLAMVASSGFMVDRDQAGPWCWCPIGASEVVCGGGLPNHEHISTFAVWQAVKL